MSLDALAVSRDCLENSKTGDMQRRTFTTGGIPCGPGENATLLGGLPEVGIRQSAHGSQVRAQVALTKACRQPARLSR